MTDEIGNRTTELTSVEKLRKYALYDRGKEYSAYVNVDEVADEIEREVSERFIKLPVDMDGVPIRIGDTMRKVGERVPIKVMSLTFYEDYVDVNTKFKVANGHESFTVLCGMDVNQLRHFEPRTIEDVLFDYEAHIMSLKEAAAELREMMEADDD